MMIGMLWFDNDNRADLESKLRRAIDYYQSKYGRTPNLCFVHPSMLPQAAPQNMGVELRTTRSVRPNHFWLGVNSGQGPAGV